MTDIRNSNREQYVCWFPKRENDFRKGAFAAVIDLHLHLDGSLSARDVLQLASLSGVSLPPMPDGPHALDTLLVAPPGGGSLGGYLQKFELPLSVLQTEQTITLAFRSLIVRLSRQGLCYAEIRFAPQLHCRGGLTQEQVVQAAVTGCAQGTEACGLPVGLILCCMRGADNRAQNMQTVALASQYLHRFVCALDLAGDEARYPTNQFVDLFAAAHQEGVPLTIHAGEAAGAQSVWTALRCFARRIGHGVRAQEDSSLLQRLREEQTVLEMCYTSNLQTGAAASAEAHPLARFLEAGLCVTLNTDNMTVSNTTLHKEYLRVQRQFSLTDEQLLQIACNAAQGAFLPDGEKQRLQDTVKQNFFRWLHQDTDQSEC